MVKGLAFIAAAVLVAALPTPCTAESMADAGFDCKAARTSIERLICSSPELRQADGRMTKNYRALSTLLDENERRLLQVEQRDWLRSRNHGCQGDDETWCLTLKTLQRGTTLGSRIQTKSTIEYTPSPRRIKRDETISICNEVADLTNRGALPEAAVPDASDDVSRIAIEWAIQPKELRRFHRFQGSDGRSRRFGSVIEGMSCPSEILFDYDHALASGSAELASLGNDPDIDHQVGREDRLLTIKGEPIVIRGNAYQVSWFGEERQQPLCYLRQTGKVAYRLRTGMDEDVCRAFEQGAISPLPWGKWQNNAPPSLVGHPHREGGLSGIADADLDGSGITRTIGLWTVTSTAGCGREHHWLVEIGPLGKQTEPTSFSRILNKAEWQGLDGGGVGLVAYRGRTYILGKWGEEAGLYSVEGDGVRRVCALDALPQVEVGTILIK